MATKVVKLDDLDATEDAETVVFSLWDQKYEIDLGEKSQAALDKALSPFVAKARTKGSNGHSSVDIAQVGLACACRPSTRS